jgi:hypothetical protein
MHAAYHGRQRWSSAIVAVGWTQKEEAALAASNLQHSYD